MSEARFTLGKDSVCYGCPEFKNIEDVDTVEHDDDVLSGGICDADIPCFAGSRNTYRQEATNGHT